MSIGLQIFDKNGVLKLDTTDRILKLVESVTIYATGSYHVTELSKYFTYEELNKIIYRYTTFISKIFRQFRNMITTSCINCYRFN